MHINIAYNSGPVVIDFPFLAEPRAYSETDRAEGKIYYSVKALIEKTNSKELNNLKNVENELKVALIEQNNANYSKKIVNNMTLPIQDGALKKADYMENYMCLNLKTIHTHPPKIYVKRDGGAVMLTDTETIKKEFYGGVICLTKSVLYPYNKGGTVSIGVILKSICKIKDGERLYTANDNDISNFNFDEEDTFGFNSEPDEIDELFK